MNTLKKAIAFAAVLATVGAIGSALAVDDIVSTKHNLSTTGGGTIKLVTAPDADTEKDQVCVFCHTPHQADTTVGTALWNRAVNTTGYTMYDSATMDMTVSTQPQGVSLACLSCHDGTIALDALRNGPGSGDYNAAAPSRGWTFNGGVNFMPTGSVANLGVDLTDDHPISVTYDITADTAFNARLTVETAGLKFYGVTGDQLECATCHNPHSGDFPPFLRMSNSGSTLCLTCHIK